MKKNLRFNAQKPIPLKTGEIPCDIPWTFKSMYRCFGPITNLTHVTMPNFIIHFKATCDVFGDDDNMTTTHLAIYMSIFYHWNRKKFAENMPVNREDIMRIACLGSFKTYYRVLKELHHCGYITYVPSHHPNIPSRVTVHDPENPVRRPPIDTTSITTLTPEIVPSINTPNRENAVNETRGKSPAPTREKERSNSTRHSRPIDLKEAVGYFREQKNSVLEAEKFYNYYQGNGWERRDRTPIKDWQAVARSWILKIREFDEKKSATKSGPKPNHLATDNDKDFDEPI
jgi:hypothetical protein